MDNTVNIKIGDVATLIRCKNDCFIDSAKEFYKNFLSESRPDYEVEIVYGKPASNQGIKKLIFTESGYIALPGLFVGQLGANSGKIVVNLQNSFSIIKYFLKILYSYLCLRKNEVMLHAAGIVKDDKGYVFIGPSDSGKSTVTELSKGCTVLSDETIIIRENMIFGTPFGTGRYANASNKICSLFRLIKDKSTYLEELDYGKGFSELLSNFLIFEERTVKTVLPLCENLINKFPLYKLHFSLDDSFWKKIEENEHIRKISN